MARVTFLRLGVSITAALLLSWYVRAGVAPSIAAERSAPQHAPIVRVVREIEIDWSAGLVTARGGAAADIRMPSADVARAGAERRARAAALSKLRAGLAEVPLGKGRALSGAALETAIARAHTLELEPQSNGGVLVRLGVDFADVVGLDAPDGSEQEDAGSSATPAKGDATPVLIVKVVSAPLEMRPRFLVGERERTVAYAVYRLEPAPESALEVRRDRAGRFVLPKGAAGGRSLQGMRAVIHLEKIAR